MIVKEKNVLLKTTLKEAFPSISVQSVHLEDCKRIVLLQYDKETEKIHFRHYLITTQTYGVSTNIKNLYKGKVQELASYEDISEYILEDNQVADSDIERDEITEVQNKGKTEQKAIRLIELGPRMELLLVKIEENLCTGTVWYHRYVNKTPEEIEEQKKNWTKEIIKRSQEKTTRRKC